MLRYSVEDQLVGMLIRVATACVYLTPVNRSDVIFEKLLKMGSLPVVSCGNPGVNWLRSTWYRGFQYICEQETKADVKIG